MMILTEYECCLSGCTAVTDTGVKTFRTLGFASSKGKDKRYGRKDRDVDTASDSTAASGLESEELITVTELNISGCSSLTDDGE